jgi:hypothetical protein
MKKLDPVDIIVVAFFTFVFISIILDVASQTPLD